MNSAQSENKMEKITMQSRCFPAIYTLFKKGQKVTKHTAADSVYCDEHTALKILTHLHVVGDIRICDWIRGNGPALPVYCMADGKKDKPRPEPSTASKTRYMRDKRRSSPELREKEAAAKRLKRANKKLETEPPRYGFWGI